MIVHDLWRFIPWETLGVPVLRPTRAGFQSLVQGDPGRCPCRMASDITGASLKVTRVQRSSSGKRVKRCCVLFVGKIVWMMSEERPWFCNDDPRV